MLTDTAVRLTVSIEKTAGVLTGLAKPENRAVQPGKTPIRAWHGFLGSPEADALLRSAWTNGDTSPKQLVDTPSLTRAW